MSDDAPAGKPPPRKLAKAIAAGQPPRKTGGTGFTDGLFGLAKGEGPDQKIKLPRSATTWPMWTPKPKG